MEENILRIVQLALAINRTKRTSTPIRCGAQIYESGFIEVRIEECGRFQSAPYFSTTLLSSHCFKEDDSEAITSCLKELEAVCLDFDIDTRQRYMKVQVC